MNVTAFRVFYRPVNSPGQYIERASLFALLEYERNRPPHVVPFGHVERCVTGDRAPHYVWENVGPRTQARFDRARMGKPR